MDPAGEDGERAAKQKAKSEDAKPANYGNQEAIGFGYRVNYRLLVVPDGVPRIQSEDSDEYGHDP